MPSANKTTGYILLGFGILILLFTFYQAYIFYNEAISGTLFASAANPSSTTQPPLGSAGNSTQSIASGIASSLISGLLSQVPIQKYAGYIFAVLLLGVFASVGYKFAMLGINELHLDNPKPEKQQTDSKRPQAEPERKRI